jgi:hypothetical protein
LTFSYKPLDHLPGIILGAFQKNSEEIVTEWVDHPFKDMLWRRLSPASAMIKEYAKMTYRLRPLKNVQFCSSTKEGENFNRRNILNISRIKI